MAKEPVPGKTPGSAKPKGTKPKGTAPRKRASNAKPSASSTDGTKPASKNENMFFPSREEILQFVKDTPGKVGKREIARAFNIKGSGRILLKRIVRELTDEGALTRSEGSRRIVPAGELPSITVIEITHRDGDGELVAKPIDWESEAPAPRIVIAPEKPQRKSDRTTPEPPAGIGDRVLARLSRTRGEDAEDFDYEARVIKRVGRGAERVLGLYRAQERGGRIEPVDKRVRNSFEVHAGDTGDAKDGDLVLAETMPGKRFGSPRVRITEVFGRADDQTAISLIAIHAQGIPNHFPAEVLAEAERAPKATDAGRDDLRDIPLITIDPQDARDHDDAVWAMPDDDAKNEGGHVVIVAIADVAAYIRPGAPMDVEARKRGNSVYFPDRVVPMLPERISNDLCSLREGEDRPCLAVRMVFDSTGHKRSHRFMRAIMRSAAKLSYGQAQQAFDGTPDRTAAPLMDSVLRPLWNAYQTVSKARDIRGPLELDLPEFKIQLDEKGHIKGVRRAERFESMRLIEEFMIQANVCAAETLEDKRSGLIYRVHDTPSAEKIRGLSEFLATIDVSFAKGQVVKPENFNKVLRQLKGGEFEQMASDVVLRSQAQAVYAPENLGHFGLNLRRYAHFTSPIRRYADLIVHRALITALKLGKDGISERELTELAEIAEHISVTERRAMVAERDSTDRFIASFLQKNIGAEFRGRIAGVTRFGLFVKLEDTGADGLIPISSLGTDYFHHHENLHALIGERTGLTFRLGSPVIVRLEEAVPVTGGLRFALIEGGTKGKARRAPKEGAGQALPRQRRSSTALKKTGKKRG